MIIRAHFCYVRSATSPFHIVPPFGGVVHSWMLVFLTFLCQSDWPDYVSLMRAFQFIVLGTNAASPMYSLFCVSSVWMICYVFGREHDLEQSTLHGLYFDGGRELHSF